MINVKYVGALSDSSGYGAAARNYICALLDTKQVDVTVGVMSFEAIKTTHGALQTRVDPLINRKLPHKIQITHLTPENFPRFKNPACYNVAYTVWETDTLPDGWVPLINTMDEVWVPSAWNKEVFEKNGVTKPIYKIVHGIAPPDLSDAKPIKMNVGEDHFIFYAIFQWIERKNPLGLLKAYLTEFKENEKVRLAIKTYRLGTSAQEKEIIKNQIEAVKKSLNLPSYPKILFFSDLFTAEQLKGFHLRGDCCVLPHRGEGFSLAAAEAMSYGKPTIATRYSGNLEFMNDDNSFLVDYQLTPVSGMIFPNYNAYMTWADPNIIQLKEHMRYVFENREEAQEIADRGRQTILEQFNWTTAGQAMLARLRAIQAKL